jgi:hypothetical protein
MLEKDGDQLDVSCAILKFINAFTAPATFPYSQENQSNPCLPIPLPEDTF